VGLYDIDEHEGMPSARAAVAGLAQSSVEARRSSAQAELEAMRARGAARMAALTKYPDDFSPDGTRIVTTGADSLVRIWTDFEPLAPSSPRLWQATTYCMPAAQRESLLGLTSAMARAHEETCLHRVAQAIDHR
jgi:hypothetical protein